MYAPLVVEYYTHGEEGLARQDHLANPPAEPRPLDADEKPRTSCLLVLLLIQPNPPAPQTQTTRIGWMSSPSVF
jgi:hypothetical protein